MNSTVLGLNPASQLTGTEQAYGVQSGGDVRMSTQAIADAGGINPKFGYNASGSIATTTGTISASSNALTIADPSTWTNPQTISGSGFGIRIAGAGPAGTDLITSVTALSGSVLTLAANASTGVSGAIVSHDDTAALNAAIAAALAAPNPVLHLSSGKYLVTSALTPISSPIWIFGDGPSSSVIVNASKTANVFTINYQQTIGPSLPILLTVSAVIENFEIIQDPNVTPTAGAGFFIASQSGTSGGTKWYVTGLRMRNIDLEGLWTGITTGNGVGANWFENLHISSTVSAGILYNSQQPSGDNHWNDIEMVGTNTGLVIAQSDTQEFTNLKTNWSGVVFTGSSGNIDRVRFVNPSIEGDGTHPTYGFDFGSGANQITIVGGEIAGCGTAPIHNTGNVINGLAILGVVTADSGFNPTGMLNILTGLPTSASGLATGTLWNNAGVLSIAP